MTYQFCTLFDKNYLTRGLALYRSLVNHCSTFRLWILCMDEITCDVLSRLNLDSVVLIKLSDFEDEKLVKVKPTRTAGEYCWTCTPSLPLYIFNNFPEVEMISYLDADLYFYSSPEPIFEEFGQNSIMIIPHRFSSLREEKEKKAGVYNVSMVTFRKDENGIACLKWWRERCLEWCYNRYEDSKIGDQKYLDEFPKLFDNVHVLKHIGANVMDTNIKQYRLSKKSDTFYVGDVPVIFYHFAGVKIYQPWPLFNFVQLWVYFIEPGLRPLIYEWYLKRVYAETRKIREFIPFFTAGFAPEPPLPEYFKRVVVGLIFKLKYELSRFYS